MSNNKEKTQSNSLNLEVPGLYILNGRQGSGKTYLIDFIMYQLRKKFHYGIVFTNTFFDNRPFPYIDKKYIFPEYDEDALTNLMDVQEKSVKKGIIREAFVIFDDCLDDEGQFKSLPLRRLTTQLRHYHITLIMSTQYTNLIPARMRANAMGIFIFNTDLERALRTLFENYGLRFGKFELFTKYLFDKLKEKYRFIYYNVSSKETDIEKLYEVTQCPPKIPTFKIEFKK